MRWRRLETSDRPGVAHAAAAAAGSLTLVSKFVNAVSLGVPGNVAGWAAVVDRCQLLEQSVLDVPTQVRLAASDA